MNRGWIFNKQLDFLVFFFPLIFALIAFQLFKNKLIPLESVGYFYFYSVILTDRAHTISTVFRSYANPEDRKKHLKILFLAPLICFPLCLLIYQYSVSWFWTAVTYFTSFHVIRQQTGLLKYSLQKEKEPFGLDIFIQYCAWGCPFLWLHTQPDHSLGWYRRFELISLPKELGPYIEGFFYLSAMLFFVSELLRTHSFQIKWINSLKKVLGYKNISYQINGGKWLIWGSSWLTGYMTVFVFENPRMMMMMTFPVIHAMPYIALIFKNEQKRRQNDVNTWFSKSFFLKPYSFVFYYIFLVLIAYSWESLWVSFSKVTGQSSLLLEGILASMLILPTMLHNSIDGVIWKTSKDPDLIPRLLKEKTT